MFFQPREWEQGAPTQLSLNLQIQGVEGYARELLEDTAARFGREGGLNFVSAEKQELPAESYELIIEEEGIFIAYADERGLIYAAVTLLQLAEGAELAFGRLYDEPDCGFRGYRGYLPGRNSFETFKKVVDLLVYYKYNYLSLEIGGAMEYKRHPEINEAWKAFAEDTHRYSGRTAEIQQGYDWNKNSIHTDNGEGDILTQDEVRELIGYCRHRGLEVYPETPFLSHTDYICLAHPELREREEDPYPDTYCPRHPEVYNYVFDILEEVIGVFEPKLINIGHDEFYTMCRCPRCKDARPEDIFVEDIEKIHGYLTEKGIRTAMWGDKLLPVVTKDGRQYGGAERTKPRSRDGKLCHIPATYLCQDRLPRDILMFHWYYAFGMGYDFVYHTHGYETVYGNMNASKVEHWRLRRRFGIKGGSCSNWGSYHPQYMQRNGQYLNLIYGANALWNPEYDADQRGHWMEESFREAFRYHYGDLQKNPYIVVTHTTELNIPYKVFYDGVFITDDYKMGDYTVIYTDGTRATLPVIYGENIANRELELEFGTEKMNAVSLDLSAVYEVGYSTLPSRIEGKTWYKTAYPNPYPEKTVAHIEYTPIREEPVETLSVEITE